MDGFLGAFFIIYRRETMKKILYALGLAAPLLATTVNATEVTDFFANEETTLNVVRYYDGEEGAKARIKGTLEGVNRVVGFPVEGNLQDKGWQYNDDALNATALKMGNVDLGREDFVRVIGVYGDPVGYTALDDTENLQGDLVPGATVPVNSVQHWLRPDNTTYSVVGDTLFRLRLEETKEGIGGEFKTLVRAWEEIKCRGLKSKKGTRHLIQNYSQQKVTQTTTKLAPYDDEVLNTTVVEFIALTRTGAYESWSNEAGLAAGFLPQGYKIVS